MFRTVSKRVMSRFGRYIRPILLLTMLAALPGCNFFSTRDPENPITNRSSFESPTSPDIVIQNFTGAIREKNPANYVACFVTDTAFASTQTYVFEPSADAAGVYPLLFTSWTVEDEQRYFIALIPDMKDRVPTIELTSSAAPEISPQSTIYTFDYTFIPVSIPYKGRMRLTIVRLANGNWAISRWTDEPAKMDQTEQTWSFLKALYGN